jgi:hypothetical protein
MRPRSRAARRLGHGHRREGAQTTRVASVLTHTVDTLTIMSVQDFPDYRSTPEWAADRLWEALTEDGPERARMGGYWLPQWTARFDREAILQDFAALEQPVRRGLQGSLDHAGVRYVAIVEGEHEDEWSDDARPTRYITLVWEPTLKFWAMAHYGPEPIESGDLPV